MLCRNLDVTFRKDAFEQSSAHSVELEQGGKDSDLHQMKNKIHDVWPEEVVQEDYYQHQILADFVHDMKSRIRTMGIDHGRQTTV